VLIQKLIVKYGQAHEVIITALVDQFVEEKAQIAPEDLAKLEKEVVLAVKTKQMKRRGESPPPSTGPAQSSTSSGQVASIQAASKTTASADPDLLKAPEPGSEWKVIAAYQELQSEAKNRAEKELERKKKTDFRKALDDHISNASEYKKKHSDSAEAAYNEHIKRDIAKFHEEERVKREKLHDKAQKQLAIQKQQIEDAKKRHVKEMEIMSKFEQGMLAEAQYKIQLEADKVSAKRAHAKAQQAIVDEDNAKNQVIRDAQLKKIAEEDARMMAEYAAKLDKDDFDRANAFNERMKKMEAFNEKFENDGAGKAMKEERIKMERLLLKEQAEAEERAVKKEHDKAMAKRNRLQRMMHENELLVNAKLEKKEKMRVEDHNYAERALDDVAKFKREEQAKKDALHRKHEVYRKVLDSQMKNKAPQADPTSAAFIGREAMINRSLYNKAVHDPKVLMKINSPDKPQQTGPRIATHK
jgi:hypothetical protein